MSAQDYFYIGIIFGILITVAFLNLMAKAKTHKIRGKQHG